MSLKPISTKSKFDKEKYKIPQKDWDDFIRSLGGVDCKLMCSNQYINKTTDLFENKNSIDVFCEWCHK